MLTLAGWLMGGPVGALAGAAVEVGIHCAARVEKHICKGCGGTASRYSNRYKCDSCGRTWR